MCIVDPLKWVNKWSLQLSTLRCIMMQNHYMNSKSDSYSPELKNMNPYHRYESPLSKEKIAFLFYWPILVNSPAWQCGKGCYLLSPHVWLMPGMIAIQDQSSSTVSLKASWTKSTSITSSRRFHIVYPIRNPNAFEWWSVHIAEKKKKNTDDPHTHHPVTCWDMHRNRNAAVPKTIAILLHLMSGNQQLIRPIKNTQFWDLLT